MEEQGIATQRRVSPPVEDVTLTLAADYLAEGRAISLDFNKGYIGMQQGVLVYVDLAGGEPKAWTPSIADLTSDKWSVTGHIG